MGAAAFPRSGGGVGVGVDQANAALWAGGSSRGAQAACDFDAAGRWPGYLYDLFAGQWVGRGHSEWELEFAGGNGDYGSRWRGR